MPRKFNQLGIRRVWRSDQLETRCGRESQHPAEWALRPPIEQLQLERRCWIQEHVPERLDPQAPGWAAQKNRKEPRLWPIEWGSICCSSVRSPTPSHTQPFQIKWEVYFPKKTVSLIFIVSSLWFCMHLQMYMYYVAIQHLDSLQSFQPIFI